MNESKNITVFSNVQEIAEKNKLFYKLNPHTCKCGVVWEMPCECPEIILENFSKTLGKNRFFYFELLEKWLQAKFNIKNVNKHVQSVLNLNGVTECGYNGYITPYEI
jgi:hypothetical protein